MSGFAEFHGELRAVARDLLGAGPGAEPGWAQVAAAGWTGLEVPEALGGAGATFAEVAVVLEELGRAAADTPYLGAVVLGVGVLQLVEPGSERDGVLAATAAGDARPVLVLSGETMPGAPSWRSFGLGPGAGDGSTGGLPLSPTDRSDPGVGATDPTVGADALTRQAAFVVDAGEATHLLVPVAGADGRPALAVVDPVAPGVSVTPEPVLDATHRLATVTAEAVAVDPGHLLPFTADPGRALALLHDRAAVATALDGLGLAGAMLDATVAYAKVREQFGRPIGSFQAVKHQCADMAVQLAIGRELVDAAVEALVAAGVGEDPTTTAEAGVAASMAASYVGDAAVAVVGTALQLHGGIGYTWESGVHAFLKRATLDRSLFGSPADHRRRLATRSSTHPAA